MKKVEVCFEKIILNDESDDEITLRMDGRMITINRLLIDETSIKLENGKGPHGSMNISEWWIIQHGLYHLCMES